MLTTVAATRWYLSLPYTALCIDLSELSTEIATLYQTSEHRTESSVFFFFSIQLGDTSKNFCTGTGRGITEYVKG